MSQPQTVPTTKNGTSESSSPKKRGRPKGWKKAKELEGNDAFKITPEIEAEVQKFSGGAYTAEDAALDAEIAALAAQNGPPAPIDDVGATVMVKKVKEDIEHLMDHADGEYMPASTMAELTEQVHMAKQAGAEAIDGTEALVKQVFRADFDKIKADIGYGIYHDVRVYVAGQFAGLKGADRLTMEQKLAPVKGTK